MEDNNYNAFVLALSLAITAPTDEMAQSTLSMAQDFSVNLDEIQFAKAKKVVDKANRLGQLDELISEKGNIIAKLMLNLNGEENA